MTKLILPLAAIAALSMTNLGHAQEFTTEDEINMQQCIETVHQYQADGENISMRECIGAASRVCMDEPGGSSTVGMSECTMRENAWWDQHLNFLYQDLKDNLTSEQFTKLRDAQRAWIKFRDADCDFNYEYWKEGTIRSTFYTSCVLDKTASRAIELEGYLEWISL